MPYQSTDLGPTFSYIQQQASYHETQMWKREYEDYQYATLAPVMANSDSPWVGNIVHYSGDYTGEAKWLSTIGTDFPTVDVSRAQYMIRIEGLGLGYDWHLQEIEQARMIGYDVLAQKVMAVRDVYERKCEEIFRNGNAEMGWDGFLNMSRVTRKDVADTGTGGDTAAKRQWKNKTGLQIAEDINDILVAPWLATKGVRMANTICMSKEMINLLATTPIAEHHPTETVMAWLKGNNTYTAQTGQALSIKMVNGLETAGSGGKGRLIAYQRHPDVIRFIRPMPLKLFPAQMSMLHYRRPGMFRLGGLNVRLSEMFRYLDGIE